MNDTDKVIIALGFFTLVGFLAYCVLTLNTGSVTLGTNSSGYVTVAELKQARQDMRNGR